MAAYGQPEQGFAAGPKVGVALVCCVRDTFASTDVVHYPSAGHQLYRCVVAGFAGKQDTCLGVMLQIDLH